MSERPPDDGPAIPGRRRLTHLALVALDAPAFELWYRDKSAKASKPYTPLIPGVSESK